MSVENNEVKIDDKNCPKWYGNIRKVIPYVPGEQPKVEGMIKLNTNENPYPPAPGVLSALKEFDGNKLRLYPDPKIEGLCEAIAQDKGVDKENVFVGVGSDDVLATAFMTFFNSEKPILFADITYSFYDVWADLFRIPYVQIPLDEEFRLVKEGFLRPNGGIVIANPNAPTGVAVDVSFIEDIIKANRDSIVIVDEAYVDFGGESCIGLLDRYDNLVVVQTFSKSRSMAGMRIGFAIASKELIRYMNDVKYSYNSYTLNSIAIACGCAAVADRKYFEETVQRIVETRRWASQELKKLGFEFNESSANFIFVKHGKVSADYIFEKLRERKIYVRHFNSVRIQNYLRISIGTDDEMRELIRALKEIVE